MIKIESFIYLNNIVVFNATFRNNKTKINAKTSN
jgi:hypothetical protein